MSGVTHVCRWIYYYLPSSFFFNTFCDNVRSFMIEHFFIHKSITIIILSNHNLNILHIIFDTHLSGLGKQVEITFK